MEYTIALNNQKAYAIFTKGLADNFNLKFDYNFYIPRNQTNYPTWILGSLQKQIFKYQTDVDEVTHTMLELHLTIQPINLNESLVKTRIKVICGIADNHPDRVDFDIDQIYDRYDEAECELLEEEYEILKFQADKCITNAIKYLEEWRKQSTLKA